MTSAAPADDGLDPDEALLEFLYRVPVGLLQLRPDGAVTMANPMAAQLLMPLAAQAGLDNLFDLLAPLAPQLREAAAAAAVPGSVVCDGLRLPVPAGVAGPQHGPARILGLTLTRLTADLLMGSVSDISQQVHEEQQRLVGRLRDAGRTDALTGLPNRSVARERIDTALAARRTSPAPGPAVLAINVDRFDQVNLAHGPVVGDALLRHLARRLTETLGGLAGCTVARLGGDAFVAVLDAPDGACADAEAVLGCAQRLLQALSSPCTVDGLRLHPTVRIGAAPGPSDAQADGDSLLQDAGIALREARRSGGGRVALFDPAMKARATWRSLMEADLREALAAGGLSVAYQPIVVLDADQPGIGVEALVRWQHPERGAVPPPAFIDVAEQTGLIGPLGAFVLDTACRQFMQWRAALGDEAPHWLSVNLSRAQLDRPGLVELVRQTLAACAMPAQALQLEVTESLAAQDDGVRAQLQALKALGLALALDDFGTGYSSLSSLHQLPVDVVKIDRSFVCQLETSAHHRALVKATIDVAQSLGMRTVAEGVETPGQARQLQALQCDKGQGWCFGRPMPGDAMAGWLADWRGRRAALLRPPPPASGPAGASRSPSGSAA